MIKLINKLKNIFSQHIEQTTQIAQDLAYLKRVVGNLEAKIADNHPVGQNRASQIRREDGIMQWLLDNIEVSRKILIELGVGNDLQSDTKFLLVHDDWSGLAVGDSEEGLYSIKQAPIYWNHNLKVIQQVVTIENINDIFISNGLQGRIGLLSIHMNGSDYWIWQAIRSVQPDMVIIGYNPKFGKELAVTVPSDFDAERCAQDNSDVYFGASARALILLAENKGYALVAGGFDKPNLFFVRKELINNRIKACTVEEIDKLLRDQCFDNGEEKIQHSGFELSLYDVRTQRTINIDTKSML